MGFKLQNGPLLKELTTLGLGGRALALATVGEEKHLEELPGAIERLGGRPFVIGKGSNLLVREGELDLVLIRMSGSGDPEVVYENGGSVRVRVPAGAALQRFLVWCVKRGFSGLESLAGIPGTVGGAVAMNAGSWGCETGDAAARVQLYGPCCGLRWMLKEDLVFEYRHFAPATVIGRDDYFLVTSVEFDLTKSSEAEVGAAHKKWLEKKKSSQPVAAATAGCVFKNPDAAPAGKLLDDAGMKGFMHGGMAFSELHANFMVNLGNGTSEQALELIEIAKTAVKDRFGVELALEVQVVS
jgi:UDP-N-acetylmuramate dehydrogenase